MSAEIQTIRGLDRNLERGHCEKLNQVGTERQERQKELQG